MRLTSYQVTIAAPVEVVWAHLTTAEGLVRWVGPEATADPIPGGMLRWTHPNGATVVGRFLELIPYRRVVFTYGWEDGRLGVAPGSTTVEIDLVEEGGATTLRLSTMACPRDRARPPAGLDLLPRHPARHPVDGLTQPRVRSPARRDACGRSPACCTAFMSAGRATSVPFTTPKLPRPSLFTTNAVVTKTPNLALQAGGSIAYLNPRTGQRSKRSRAYSK